MVSKIRWEPRPSQAPGVSTSGLDHACLNVDIAFDELSTCINRWKSGKSPGIAGSLADMIKDGGLLMTFALQLRPCGPLP